MKKVTYIISLLNFFPLLAGAADVRPLVVTADDSSLDSELAWLHAEAYTITASKIKESLDKTTATVTTITQQQISEMGARNLLDVLKNVPGFGVTQSAVGVRQIEVRGVRTLYSEKVLYMLNGHPLDQNLHFASGALIYDNLPVDTIKRLEIVRGPGSALYGANAFMAVVNIITQNAKDLNGFHASAGGGSFGTKQVRASWGKQFSNSFEAALHFNFTDTNGISSPLYTDSTRSTLGKSPLTERTYDLEWQLGYKDFKFDGRFITKRQGLFFGITQTLNDNVSNQNYDDYFLKLSRKWSFGNSLTLDTQVYFDSVTPHFQLQLAPNTYLFSSYKDSRIGGEIQANYTLSDTQTLIAGFSYAKETHGDITTRAGANLSSSVSVPDTSIHSKRSRWGVYVQDMWDPYKSLHLVLGARYDQYSIFGGTFNPRAGLNWEFIKDYSLKFSYGTAYRAPAFNELSSSNNPILQGNSTLRPETQKTFEGGIIAHPVSGLTTQVTYYHIDIKSIISPVLTANTGVSRYDNSGSLTTQGVEGEIRYDFTGDLHGSYLSANSVWQSSIQSDRQAADVPRYRTNLMANWAIDNTWSSFAHVLIKSRTLRDLGDARANSVSGYALVDLGIVGKNIFNQKIDVGFNIYNLFDKRYYDPAPPNLGFVGDFQAAGIAFFGHVDVHF